ncbi:MAG: cation:proton antiporter [Alphaproteobacteria bacterium]
MGHDAVTGMVLHDVLIVLAAGVVTAAALHRLSVSPLLGYFLAGFAIGPHALAFVDDDGSMRALAEFGVVFLLFAIGLELPLKRLWVMRRWLVGLGFLQVAITSLAIGLVAAAAGFGPAPAIVIGGAFALSSTAVGLQILVERGELASRHGRAAFSILLVQDLAVVPLLVLLPHLGRADASVGEALGLAAIEAFAVLAGIALVGRFALRPLLHAVARTRNAELFVAAALLLVLGAAVATQAAGLSMALGGFLAGMLLADSEFRHQIEADIRPFRGLLLGLFFMTVGMTIDPTTMATNAAAVAAIVAMLAVGKSAVVMGLARGFGLSTAESVRVGLVLGHAGEFAFVIVTVAASFGVLAAQDAQVLIAGAALSMALCPALDGAGRAWAGRRVEDATAALDALADELRPVSDHVIVAGYGRVGQVVGRILSERGLSWIALDADARRVAEARRLGKPVHFGDATRAEVLRAAGAGRARAVAITLDRAEHAEHTLHAIRHAWPGLAAVSRARDPAHARALVAAGARTAVPEAMEASLELGSHVLDLVGTPPDVARALVESLRGEWGPGDGARR